MAKPKAIKLAMGSESKEGQSADRESARLCSSCKNWWNELPQIGQCLAKQEEDVLS